jgi:hypothetical protein
VRRSDPALRAPGRAPGISSLSVAPSRMNLAEVTEAEAGVKEGVRGLIRPHVFPSCGLRSTIWWRGLKRGARC